MNNIFLKKRNLAIAISVALTCVSGVAVGQENTQQQGAAKDNTEVIVVTGIRSALASALQKSVHRQILSKLYKLKISVNYLITT